MGMHVNACEYMCIHMWLFVFPTLLKSIINYALWLNLFLNSQLYYCTHV